MDHSLALQLKKAGFSQELCGEEIQDENGEWVGHPTLLCWLFGHSFLGSRMVYEPHYLKLTSEGMAVTCTSHDYHYETFQMDYCVRCGVDKK